MTQTIVTIPRDPRSKPKLRHTRGPHSKSAAQGRMRDGWQNYVHFVTAYDIHFIVNNKYYAMNTGKVRNLPIFSKKFPAFGAII